MSFSLFLRIHSIFLAGNFENYLVFVVLYHHQYYYTWVQNQLYYILSVTISGRLLKLGRSNSAVLSLLTHWLLYIVGIGKKIYIMASFDNVQWFYL